MPLIHCKERRSALLDRTSPRVSLSSHKAFFFSPQNMYFVLLKNAALCMAFAVTQRRLQIPAPL